MSLLEQIEAVVNDMTDNNNPPQIVEISKAHDNNKCDIVTSTGALRNIDCSGTATAGNKGLLIYNEGDAGKPFVLLFNGGGGGDLSNYYTKAEINEILSSYVTSDFANTHYANIVHDHNDLYYLKEQVNTLLNQKQAKLISGNNIKTINGEDILGSGNINTGSASVDIATYWHNPTSDERVPSEKLAKTTLDEKVNRSELHNLDINLTTLELVPKTDNPAGVICFDDVGSKYIEKSNTVGLVKNDGTIDTTQYLSSLPAHNHDDRYYTESEVDTALNGKQATLVSGTNIKTINNTSILGSGNIDIQGGGGSVIGTGSFSINSNGHLIVELPNAVDNPYFINSNGHLIYDTSNTHNGS